MILAVYIDRKDTPLWMKSKYLASFNWRESANRNLIKGRFWRKKILLKNNRYVFYPSLKMQSITLG